MKDTKEEGMIFGESVCKAFLSVEQIDGKEEVANITLALCRERVGLPFDEPKSNLYGIIREKTIGRWNRYASHRTPEAKEKARLNAIKGWDERRNTQGSTQGSTHTQYKTRQNTRQDKQKDDEASSSSSSQNTPPINRIPTKEEVEEEAVKKGIDKEWAAGWYVFASQSTPPWTDNQGKPIRNWKLKLLRVWEAEKKYNRLKTKPNQPEGVVLRQEGYDASFLDGD